MKTSVQWLDIMTYGDRRPLSVAKLARLAICETVGILIAEDEAKIVIAHSKQTIPDTLEDFVSEYTVIPKGCIISREDYE